MTTDYITRAIRFINQIAPYLSNPTCLDDTYWDIMEFNKDYRRHVMMYHGATRIALVTSDYVIKLDYDSVELYGGCERELEFYKFAHKAGYENYVTPVTRIECNGIKFYVYPRAKYIGRAHLWELPMPAYFWLINHIHDLHNDNIGMIDGHPVIIDYALNTLWT